MPETTLDAPDISSTDYLATLAKPPVGPDGDIRSENKAGVVAACKEYFKDCDSYKAKIDRSWISYYRISQARQWRSYDQVPEVVKKIVPRRTYNISANLTGHLERTFVGWLLGRQPDYTAMVANFATQPETDLMEHFSQADLQKKSEEMELLLRTAWTSGHFSEALVPSLMDMATFGVGVAKIFADDVPGKATLASVPIWNAFYDPTATDLSDTWGFHERSSVPLIDLISKFGEVARLVKVGVTKTNSYSPREVSAAFGRGIDSKRLSGGVETAGTTAPSKHVLGVRDESGAAGLTSSEEVTRTDTWVRSAFKDGWHHYVWAGEVLLHYEFRQALPYVDFNYVKSETPYGLGMAAILYPIQVAIDLILSLVLNSIRFTCFPIFAFEDWTLDGSEDILAEPGSKIRLNQGGWGRVGWLPPPPLPPYVGDYLGQLISLARETVGLPGFPQGQGQTPPRAVGILQQQAETSTVLIRTVAHQIDASLERLLEALALEFAEGLTYACTHPIPPGFQDADRSYLHIPAGYFAKELPVLDEYDQPKERVYLDGDGQPIPISLLDQFGQPLIGEDGEPIYQKDEDGNPRYVMVPETEQVPLGFAVFLESGSSHSTVALREDIWQLAKAGLIDQQGVYEGIEYPGGGRRIIARMEAKQADIPRAVEQMADQAAARAGTEGHGGQTPGPEPSPTRSMRPAGV